ncbi:hypothetical protein JVU11DRAFT_3782 [Chiua virens]|nr:hypothetical protein JVU11DRAFT_3782 [Chiua virens]
MLRQTRGSKMPSLKASKGGLTFSENNRFMLYTSSRDFLPNSDTDFDDLRKFICTQLGEKDPQKMLHAIWICMKAPLGGERLNESGVERILDVAHKKVPVIIVLTKFDLLVDSIASVKISNLGGDDKRREEAERILDNTLKNISLDSLLSQQLVTPVSTMTGYEDTVSTLIQSTDAAIQKFHQKRTHDTPIALAWAIAQRQDLETTIAATIDVGSKGYWSGLRSTTKFKGKLMEHCVSVIHKEIIAIWNIYDSSGYLAGGDFKARMAHLVEDIVHAGQSATSIHSSPCAHGTFVAATASPISAMGAAAEAPKWVSDVYQTSPTYISHIIGYIVDLVMVLVFLSEIHQLPETHLHTIEEDAVDAIKEYLSSGLLSEMHKEVCKLAVEDKLNETSDWGDVVLKRTVRLVNKFYPRARDRVEKVSRKFSSPAISVGSVSDDSLEKYGKGESIFSHATTTKPRVAHRRGAQDAIPDILAIVEEATKIPTARSTSGNLQPSTLLIPERSPAESSKHSPLNPLNWIRPNRDRGEGDEEVGKP